MMALKQTSSLARIQVQLFKDQTLGVGSYGKVRRARYGSLTCAAKLIHETLVDKKRLWPGSYHVRGSTGYRTRSLKKSVRFFRVWGTQTSSSFWEMVTRIYLPYLWSSWTTIDTLSWPLHTADSLSHSSHPLVMSRYIKKLAVELHEPSEATVVTEYLNVKRKSDKDAIKKMQARRAVQQYPYD